MTESAAVTAQAWSDEPAERAPGAYRPIRDYALVGDCHGAALVARDGGVDWCCLGRFDAEAVLCRVLDADRGGFLDVRPEEPFRATRAYLANTNVLRTTFATAAGRVALTDFMPVDRRADAAEDDFVSLEAPSWFVRIVEGVEGRLRLRVRFRPSGPDYDRERPRLRPLSGGVAAESGPTLQVDAHFTVGDDGAEAVIEVADGERRHLILTSTPPHRPVAPKEADRLLESTRAFWEVWLAHCCYDGPYRDAVRRSALVLKLLSYAPTGAHVAAPTASLPEAIDGNRNWDYRYCWLRDAALVLYELPKLGLVDEAQHFDSFLDDHCLHSLDDIKIMYGIHGERDLTERELGHLDGYRGSRPVRVGNGAHNQLQIDVYGQVLDWAYLHVALFGAFDEEGSKKLCAFADRAAACWDEADAGIWEMRCEPMHHVHGKIMSWAALDRAIRIFPDGEERWGEARDAIVQEVQARGIDPEGGYLLQALDRPGSTDAAVLLAPAVGYPLDDATLAKTVEAVERKLRRGPYVLRYDTDDGLAGKEGGFLICSFWLADAYLALGREREARELYERLLSQANDVGLFSEQIDPETGEFLGNFPQAFTHLALIGTALNLELFKEGGQEAVRGTHADRARRRTGVMAGLSDRWQAV